MARGRMISSTLGESRRYASLATDTARVLYPLIVANTDAGGRLEADPLYVTRKVCTRLPYDQAQVEQALNDMHNVGLIILYGHAGVPYLQVVKFRVHNTPHHKEPDSEIPPPPGYNRDGTEKAAAENPDQDENPDDGSKQGASTDQASGKHGGKQADKGSKGKGTRREVEGKGSTRERATPTPQDHPTSEEAFMHVATTGTNPHTREHAVRERIRRCAGRDFQSEHDDDIPRWSREHEPSRIDALWEAAKPEHWRGTPKHDKRRVWIFEDLLNQDVQPPAESAADDPLRQYVEMGL